MSNYDTNYMNMNNSEYNPPTAEYSNPTTTGYSNPTTTGYSNPTTTGSIPYTTQPVINDITQLLPNLSSETIVSLLNSGVDLMKLYSDKNYMSEKGMNFDSEMKSPSTNIYQKNFSGTSNVYSPYLYYNKNSNSNELPEDMNSVLGATTTTRPMTTMGNSPTLTMTNQKIKSNENKLIVENNQYEVNFKNNKLQICNKTTYNCNILYNGNNNNIELLIHKEGYLTITNKDTEKVVWTTNTSYNKNNFFNISNDNKFTLLITDNGEFKIIDNVNNTVKWSSLVTHTTTMATTTTKAPTTTMATTTTRPMTTMGNTTTTRPMTTMGNTTTTRPMTTMGNTTTTRPMTTMGNTTTTRPMTTMGNTTTTRPTTTMGNTTTTRPTTTMATTTTKAPTTTMGNTTTTRPTTTMATTTTKAPTTTMATTTTKAPTTTTTNTLEYKWINFGTPYGEYKDDITKDENGEYIYDDSFVYTDPETTPPFTHQGKTYKYGKTKTLNNLTFEDYINFIVIEPGIIVLQYIAEI